MAWASPSREINYSACRQLQAREPGDQALGRGPVVGPMSVSFGVIVCPQKRQPVAFDCSAFVSSLVFVRQT